ncbi:transposase domain-containing protein [Persicobacter diffluens]
MFVGSESGGYWAATFYSFFPTCKLNEVNPYQWLKHTLENIRSTPEKKISSLLPQNFSE